MLYRTDDVAAGRGDIYARRLGGDTTTIPIAVTDAEETSATVSPDGHWIAYAMRIEATKEVVVRPFPNIDAGRVQVSMGGGAEPLWSTNGRTLFYHNGVTGEVLSAEMTPDGTFPVSGRSVRFQSAPREYLDNDDTRQYALMPDGSGFVMIRRVRRPAESAATRLILREGIAGDR